MDPFASYSTSLNAPIRSGAPVTPNDNDDLPVLPRALYIGSGGDIAMTPCRRRERHSQVCAHRCDAAPACPSRIANRYVCIGAGRSLVRALGRSRPLATNC